MRYIQSYYTDIGPRRKKNQDSLALLKAETDFGEALLAVMCDGMGGSQLGELASKTIVKSFEKWFKSIFPALLYSGLDVEKVQTSWETMVREDNSRMVAFGKSHGIKMGTTLTAFLFVEDDYYAIQVGDSRGYVIKSDYAQQITNDHSLVAEELRKGLLTEEQARVDKRKNILLECVGITSQTRMDFYSGKVMPGACYMLCTDGFWHTMSQKDLTRYLAGSQFTENKTIHMHLHFLVEQAKERGETDNISAIGIVPFLG